MRVGFLHLAPKVGAVEGNRALIERGTRVASEAGAAWVLSGELVVTGYQFATIVGTSWIEPAPSAWLTTYVELCSALDVTSFVSHPERTPHGLYNSAFVIGREGSVLGSHRKLHPTAGSESWSAPGDRCHPVMVDGLSVGLLICADAYRPEPARRLRDAGAELIVSLAAWWPGPYGPAGEWEQRTTETGIPMLLCNRTGHEDEHDMTGAISGVIADGERLLELSSDESAVFVVDVALGEVTGATLVARYSL